MPASHLSRCRSRTHGPSPKIRDFLGERGPVGAAQVVPAVPQLRRRPPDQQGPLGQQAAQRRPQQRPADEEGQPDVPAERGQHHAGQKPAEPVAERAGQGHRRVRRTGEVDSSPLAADSWSSTAESSRCSIPAGAQTAWARRRCRPVDIAAEAVRRQQILGRAAQQRQRVRGRAEPQRDQQRVPARRAEPVASPRPGSADRAAQGDQGQDGQDPVGHDEQSQHGQQARTRLPQQPEHPQPR